MICLVFSSSRQTNQIRPFVFLENLRLANLLFEINWPLVADQIYRNKRRSSKLALQIWTRHIWEETPCEPPMLSRRKSSGDPDFLAKSLTLKSLANPDKIFKKKMKKNCQWFSQNIRRPPTEGLWTISAGTTLLVHTVILPELTFDWNSSSSHTFDLT